MLSIAEILSQELKQKLEYVENVISDYVTKLNLSVYRQDFNFAPLEYWQNADKNFYDGRTGICENHYVKNLYR